MGEHRQTIGDVFHGWNAALNDFFFGPRAGYQKFYRALVGQKVGAKSVVIDLGSGMVDVRNWLPVPKGMLLVSCDYNAHSLAGNRSLIRVAADATKLPFANESVDLLISDNLVEHLAAPELFLAECARVLKRGGSLIFATPNKYSYVAIFAAVTPTRAHRLLKRAQRAKQDSITDTCETLYRANTVKAIKNMARGTGLEVRRLDVHVGAPCYSLFLVPPLHLPFILLHRLLESSSALRKLFGISLVAELRKAGGGSLPSEISHAESVDCNMQQVESHW